MHDFSVYVDTATNLFINPGTQMNVLANYVVADLVMADFISKDDKAGELPLQAVEVIPKDDYIDSILGEINLIHFSQI